MRIQPRIKPGIKPSLKRRKKLFIEVFTGVSLSLMLFVGNTAGAKPQEFSSGSERNQLIELYTSEGCSSCPPADRWLTRLVDHPQLWEKIVPIAFHVDYWNYLGWKDRFASKSYSRRQGQLKRDGNVASVYTPGFVVNGEEWRGFFHGRTRPSLPVESVGKLSLSIDGDQFSASFSSEDNVAEGNYVLTIALLGMDLTTNVKAGENHGRELEHQFVVLDDKSFDTKGSNWQGDLTFFSEETAERYALVAWVTQPGSLTPVQALGGWFEPENLEQL